jgi:RNA polymerase sigma-70 factor, ECF subfamily
MSQLSDFEKMALPHMDAAYNLASWLVRNPSDAEDIVQESYLRAFRAFHSFAGTNFRPWLLAIVRNVAYRWLGNRRRSANVISIDEAFGGHFDQEPAEAQIPSEDATAEEQLIGEVDRALVRTALDDLPPIFREVLVLREIEGLPYRDIAEVVGAPIGTVMSRLARGRKELRKTLTKMIKKDEANAL